MSEVGQEVQAGELRDADIHFISLVDKAANRRTFKRMVFKSADAPDEPEPDASTLRRMWQVLRSLFAGGPAASAEKAEGTAKAPPSFAEQVGRIQLETDLGEAHWLLREVLAGILGSDAANKAELVGQAIDEFKGYVLSRLQQVGVAKAAREVAVRKVGRKMAKDRLEKLTQAIALLQQILSEVQDEPDGGEEEDSMDRDAVQRLVDEAVAKAVVPIRERIERLEASAQPKDAGAQAASEPKSEPLTAEAVSKMVEEAVTNAVKPLEERLSVVEKARIGNAAQVDVSKGQVGVDFWGGVFLG